MVILLSMAFLSFLAFSPVATAAETRRVLRLYRYEGIDIRVYAPYQAYPGDRITIRVIVTALEDLEDVTVTIYVFGSKSDAEGRVGYDSWDDEIGVLYMDRLDEDDRVDEYYRLRVPSDSDPGLVYGLIDCAWRVYRTLGWEDRSYRDAFTITYLRNKDYEDLQVDYSDLLDEHNKLVADYDELSGEYSGLLATYNSLKSDYASLRAAYDSLSSNYGSLKSSYESLQADYSELSSDYDELQGDYNSLNSEYNSLLADYDALKSEYETSVGELSTSRNLMYVFVVTTVAFVATSIILLVRKPKTA